MLAIMETKEMNKEKKARSFFTKVLEDKRAINECIRKGGDLKQIANERGIKFATPI